MSGISDYIPVRSGSAVAGFLGTAKEIAEKVQHGQLVCVPPDYSGCAMAVVLELIRRETRGLHLLGVPQIGLQADLLIGAGCVASVDAAAVTLGEFGQAPRFAAAVREGQITMHDSTCPVIHAGLQAAEKGIPFMPLRGILGSDLVHHRSDWKTINNPFVSDDPLGQPGNDPLLLVPAIKPDVALFHAPIADTRGNVWIGVRRELMLMAHAANSSFVSVEKIVEGDLLKDPALAAGVIPSLYISELASVPGGAAPVGMFGCYDASGALLKRYAREARSESGFQSILDELLNVA